MTAITDRDWSLARVIHEARERECWADHQSIHRQKWPPGKVTRHNYGHNPQPWVDIALAQARAALEWMEIQS